MSSSRGSTSRAYSVVPQEVDEQQPRLDVARVLGAVHGHRDPHAHAVTLATARRSARVVSSATKWRL
jgi:hypothetical protein